MSVAFVVPYFGAPELLERCVSSLLAQTYRDFRVYLIGDGEEPPLHLHDGRLVVHTISRHRGSYFARQVAVLAATEEWLAPIGADDWVEPTHLEAFLAASRGYDAVLPGRVIWESNRPAYVRKGIYETGIMRREVVCALGGYNIAEIIGQDTILVWLLRQFGKVRILEKPTYHRVRRRGSLTTSPATAFGSRARTMMKARNRKFIGRCRVMPREAVRAYRESLLSEELRIHLAEEVALLTR